MTSEEFLTADQATDKEEVKPAEESKTNWRWIPDREEAWIPAKLVSDLSEGAV